MNRPVEALRDLERSIELNDNRAVYRSRQLLDQDRAARGTSFARIYNDLGFIQRGIAEAGNALALDPGNSGAHRFLSDVYRDTRRRELSRVSELLQSQLLQDINITPIQPSQSEANLNIVTQGGPADSGVNEFTPLFEHNQVQVTGSGVVGSNETLLAARPSPRRATTDSHSAPARSATRPTAGVTTTTSTTTSTISTSRRRSPSSSICSSSIAGGRPSTGTSTSPHRVVRAEC